METRHTFEPSTGTRGGWRDRIRSGPTIGITHEAAGEKPPKQTRAGWVVVALTLLIGLGEAMSAGLGWPWLRLPAAAAIAWLLTQRRRAPLPVLVAITAVNLVANLALRAAGHFLLVSGLMMVVAIYALVRWAPVREVVAGLTVVAGQMLVGFFVNPNWSPIGALLFYGSPVLMALAVRPWPDHRTTAGHAVDSRGAPAGRSRAVRVFRAAGVVLVMGGVLVVSGGGFLVDQFHTYVTRTRSPRMPSEWLVDAATLRRAAEASQGTHGPDGGIIHTVDYPHELLRALQVPTFSVEADVTVIDGDGFLQHDPKDPVGIPLLEFLEYAAIAEFPIVKLDLKCDRVGPVMDDVREAVDRFGLDPARVHFNADVFRGPASTRTSWVPGPTCRSRTRCTT